MGKKYQYLKNDEALEKFRKENAGRSYEVNRMKGLGEMDKDELWETTMDPERRTLRRITLDDAAAAEQVFSILMGEEVEPRKAWIEENAKYVVNLDI